MLTINTLPDLENLWTARFAEPCILLNFWEIFSCPDMYLSCSPFRQFPKLCICTCYWVLSSFFFFFLIRIWVIYLNLLYFFLWHFESESFRFQLLDHAGKPDSWHNFENLQTCNKSWEYILLSAVFNQSLLYPAKWWHCFISHGPTHKDHMSLSVSSF